MEEMKLLIQVTEELQQLADASMHNVHWNKRSIYKIPASVKDLNKTAYRPQTVSFGPYHYNEEHLKPMEEHKQRALLYFLKRTGKPLQLFVQSLNEVVQVLKNSYDSLDESWKKDTSGFLQLMMLDGCFILEILGLMTSLMDNYAPDDPVFSNHGKLYIMPYIRRDMLMLENQLPMLVLYTLVKVESNGDKDEKFVNRLIVDFFLLNAPENCVGKCSHVLDLYRKILLLEGPSSKPQRSRSGRDVNEGIIRSATELDEAGISFQKSKTKSLRDITFRHGVLKLPVIVVDDATEATLLNLMAFERFHVGAGNEVTSYVFFMDNIIDNERDVALLHSKGIIQNAIGSDKAVAKLFNSLSKDVTLDPDSRLDVVYRQVNAYSQKPWNQWRANLIHTYFRNPWAILSLIAALFLFGLTIVSTAYGVLSYYQQAESPPPPVASMPPPPLPVASPTPPPIHSPRPSLRHP